jgi:Domain of unknown function DUF29
MSSTSKTSSRRSRIWQILERESYGSATRPKLLRDNPSLSPRQRELYDEAYDETRAKAAIDANLPIRRFPRTCPYTLEQVMDDAFWPGEPWAEFQPA